VVVAGPATLQVTDLPNLVFYTPPGWSDKLVVATNLDSLTDATVVTSAQDIYVNWAVANTSVSGDVLFPFYTQLYVDGLLSQTWPVASLPAGQNSIVKNYLLGKLPAGTHTLRLETDATGVVLETDRSDNSYSKSVVVVNAGGNPAPRLISATVSAGLFQLNISGVTGRSYEVLASTNLTTWQVVATLIDTNVDGLMQFSESTVTTAKARFYRARLVGP
jgi:hypothetical protein